MFYTEFSTIMFTDSGQCIGNHVYQVTLINADLKYHNCEYNTGDESLLLLNCHVVFLRIWNTSVYYLLQLCRDLHFLLFFHLLANLIH